MTKTELQRSSSAYQKKINRHKERIGELLGKLSKRKSQARRDYIKINQLKELNKSLMKYISN